MKGQSKVLPVTGFAKADTQFQVIELTRNGKFEALAIIPNKKGKIYKKPTNVGKQDGEMKLRRQTVTARKDGESVIMALTPFLKADTDYIIIGDETRPGCFSIVELDVKVYKNLINNLQIDEAMRGE